MKSQRCKNTVVGLLLIGISFITIGWLVETVLFVDLGAHSTNSQVFDVIESAAKDGTLANLNDETELHNAALRVANEASRASMDSVRSIRSLTVWLYGLGGLFITAGVVGVVRIPVAVLDTGE